MSLARQIVEFAIKAGSSDIHLEEGSPIAIRVNSDIRILENIIGPNDMSRLLSEIVGEEKLLLKNGLVKSYQKKSSFLCHLTISKQPNCEVTEYICKN